MSQDLAEHLRFYRELGVSGVSRDAAWRLRAKGAEAAGDAHDTVSSGASSGGHDGGHHFSGASDAEAGLVGHPFKGAGPVGVNNAEELLVLETEIGPACMRCKLCTLGRRQVVFGVGNPKARLMFVGEAPGDEEDKQGEPFVGRSGQLLTKIIEAIGLTRDQVYIANVIKCRPPENRNPEADEVATCEPFLFRQLDIIQPRVIVSLGKFAAQSLLKTTEPITRLRGREYSYRGASLIPTFHPAFLLRTPSAKRDVWEDMKRVRALLQGDE